MQLVTTLLKYICGEGAYKRAGEEGLILGAVLVFLPGQNLLEHCIYVCNTLWYSVQCRIYVGINCCSEEPRSWLTISCSCNVMPTANDSCPSVCIKSRHNTSDCVAASLQHHACTVQACAMITS